MRGYCFCDWVRSMTVVFLSLDFNINGIKVKRQSLVGTQTLLHRQFTGLTILLLNPCVTLTVCADHNE